jgi:hypothetical protein
MGSLVRKIHSELLYGFTSHRLPITTSLVHRPSHAYAGRSSLFLRGSFDRWGPDLFMLRRGRSLLCRGGHEA